MHDAGNNWAISMAIHLHLVNASGKRMAAKRASAVRRLEKELKNFTSSHVYENLRIDEKNFEDWLRTIALFGSPLYTSWQRR